MKHVKPIGQWKGRGGDKDGKKQTSNCYINKTNHEHMNKGENSLQLHFFHPIFSFLPSIFACSAAYLHKTIWESTLLSFVVFSQLSCTQFHLICIRIGEVLSKAIITLCDFQKTWKKMRTTKWCFPPPLYNLKLFLPSVALVKGQDWTTSEEDSLSPFIKITDITSLAKLTVNYEFRHVVTELLLSGSLTAVQLFKRQ